MRMYGVYDAPKTIVRPAKCDETRLEGCGQAGSKGVVKRLRLNQHNMTRLMGDEQIAMKPCLHKAGRRG